MKQEEDYAQLTMVCPIRGTPGTWRICSKENSIVHCYSLQAPGLGVVSGGLTSSAARQKGVEMSKHTQASELLRIIEDFLGWFGERDYGDYESGVVDESRLDWLGLSKVLDRAEAAIAKATGGGE